MFAYRSAECIETRTRVLATRVETDALFAIQDSTSRFYCQQKKETNVPVKFVLNVRKRGIPRRAIPAPKAEILASLRASTLPPRGGSTRLI